MVFNEESVTEKIGEQEIKLSTGKLARQANGAIYGQSGATSVLATACAAGQDRPDIDFLPLQVEYNEKYYAAGKIPGGFFKREGRPKEREILVSRLIDRPLRPLFPKKLRRELQVIPTVLAVDHVHSPDILAINCASAAVMISDIPFDGPVGAVRVTYSDGKLVVNPVQDKIENAGLDIIVAGTVSGITMVEGGALEVAEELLLEAIELAREPIAKLCAMQNELAGKVGKEKFAIAVPESEDTGASGQDEFIAAVTPKLTEACFVTGKHTRDDAIRAVKQEALEQHAPVGDDASDEAVKKRTAFGRALSELETTIVRNSILQDKKRTDGRGPDEIRPIRSEVGVLPRVHGSALFTRGETQSLSVVTLGTIDDEQIRDDIAGDRRESFMLHYNFPPFSVGETGRLMTGRREIGHGELASRALRGITPKKDTFPYTIRLVSEILESNGSSSMATVCAGSMAMMDAGIPLAKPVAGIAMGLISDGSDFVVLSDILGAEDHLGDMDFKVAGTADGITAFQMDIKIKNVDADIMRQALLQAKEGRLSILKSMSEGISEAKEQLSEHAPRIINFNVDPEVLGTLIGPGGKTIKAINEKFDVSTNIADSGVVTIYCSASQAGEDAKAAFLELLQEPEIGKVYEGSVKRVVDFGAFIEFLPGKEGLCHISKMSRERIANVSDVLTLNQEVQVQIIDIDKMGRVNLCLMDESGKPLGGRSADGGFGGGGGRGRDDDRFSRPRRDDDRPSRPRRDDDRFSRPRRDDDRPSRPRRDDRGHSHRDSGGGGERNSYGRDRDRHHRDRD